MKQKEILRLSQSIKKLEPQTIQFTILDNVTTTTTTTLTEYSSINEPSSTSVAACNVTGPAMKLYSKSPISHNNGVYTDPLGTTWFTSGSSESL
jgi:hypothetical protein